MFGMNGYTFMVQRYIHLASNTEFISSRSREINRLDVCLDYIVDIVAAPVDVCDFVYFEDPSDTYYLDLKLLLLHKPGLPNTCIQSLIIRSPWRSLLYLKKKYSTELTIDLPNIE